jgi:hypothetical protein
MVGIRRRHWRLMLAKLQSMNIGLMFELGGIILYHWELVIDVKKVIKNNLLMIRFITNYCPAHIVITMLKSLLSSGVVVVNILLIRFVVNSLTINGRFATILFWILLFLFQTLLWPYLVHGSMKRSRL